MSGPTITTITLGESISADVPPQVAEERASALEDFAATNNMVPQRDCDAVWGPGPFDLCVEKVGNNLGLVFSSPSIGTTPYTVSISLSPLRRAIKDYAQIVESYYDAIRTGAAARIEAVDMARRGVHNDAAEILIDRLEGKVALDHHTARRLFTIINAIRYDGRGGMR